jgi:hypothetical protein
MVTPVRPQWLLIAFGLVAFAAPAMAAPTKFKVARCKTDSDCPGTKVCVKSTCEEAGAASGVAPAACKTDNDCPGSMLCSQNTCAEPPAVAAPPSPAPAAAAPPTCAADKDCPGNQVCIQNKCNALAAAAPAAPPPPAPAPAAAPPTVPLTAQAPPPGSLPIRFEPAKGSYKYHVAASQSGRAPTECNAPCTLYLAPGQADVTVSGDGSLTRTIDVSSQTSKVTVSTTNTSVLVSGAVVGGLGLIGSIVSLVMIMSIDNDPQTVGQAEANVGSATGGLVVASVSAGALITGVVLMAVSGRNNLATEEGLPVHQAGLRLRGIGAVPAPCGGGLLGASFAF